MKILYVEDNPLDADLTARVLEKDIPDVEIQIMDRIESAWRNINDSKHPFDLILIDLILPDGNGIDLLARLRENHFRIPIIMMAGTSDEEIAIAALKSGANDYIVKNGSYLKTIVSVIDKTLYKSMATKDGQFRSIRLLYAERNPMDIDLTYRHMNRFAPYIRMDSVHTAEEALEYIYPLDGENAYDVLMLDYRLPGKSGLQLLEELQADEAFDIPVIIVTGQGDQDAVLKAHQLGAIDYLIKTPGYLFQLPIMIENAYHQAQLIREHHALQRSEHLFRLLAENAGDMIYRISIKQNPGFEYISPAVEEVLGYSAEEMYAQPELVYNVVHPDDQYVFASMFEGEIDAKEAIVFRMFHKDGTLVWIEERNVYIRDSDGEIEAIEGIARNVTEQRKADAERRVLLEETRRRVEELETVNQILIVSRAANSMEEMFSKLLDQALSFMSLETGIVWIFSTEMNKIQWYSTQGWLSNFEAELCNNAFTYFNEFIQENQTQRISVFSEEIRKLFGKHEKSDALDAGGLWLPIIANKKYIGALLLFVPGEIQVKQNDIQLLETLASITGTAAHRIQLFDQTQNQLQRLTALRVVDAAISSSLDLKVIFNVLIEHVISQLRIDAVAVLLFNPVTKLLDYASGSGFKTQDVSGITVNVGESVAGLSVIEQKVIILKNPAEHPWLKRNLLFTNHGFQSYIAVPLISKGTVKGVLELYHNQSLPADIEWMNFLKTLSNQVAIALDNAELFDSLQRSNIELSLAYDATIVGWSKALELRDRETKGHSMRVTDMTITLAQKMGISSEELIHVRRGALLHDIGKMGIPDAILNKPGPLTEEEWEIMRMHPVYAHDLLSPIEFLKPALVIPYGHHERYNGSGYPRGLKGKTIPMAARVFAVIDVWDALCSDRPYREAWPEEKVLQYILDQREIQFDSEIVRQFLEMRIEGNPELNQMLTF
ncbi:MAG: response regulator [Anaerolineaceae bacterium]|nr:response regulator [Anaerolineaceae bacterium]